MNYTVVLGILLQVFVFCVLSKNLPSYIHVCKRNDPELDKCFINTFNEIRPHLKQGIPELNIPPGEPLHYLNASGNTGRGTSVTLDASTWNQVATGVMDAEVKAIKLDLDHAGCKGTLFFPFIRLQGEYRFKGKMLLFEIDTVGKFDINATAVTAHAEWFGKFLTKEGEQYIEFEKVTLSVQIEKPTVHFTNLINGNEILTQTLNVAINDNIDIIMEELDPVISETFGGIGRQYFNIFFGQFPVDQLFPRN